jgi:microcystin degradation protein MlrC
MRIAIGGFQHETNSFAPMPATRADFETADAWPGLTRGAELFDAIAGINLPAAGFVTAARSARHQLLPLSWCSATPSGPVTEDAFEYVSDLLLGDLAAIRHLDAIYLDLHGAMVAEHCADADGELLRRVRTLVGPDVALVASLDFHANVSPGMVAEADALVAYRTYPHVDMAATGERALAALTDLRGLHERSGALEQLPFLIPLTSQSTLAEPMRTLSAQAAGLENAAGIVTVSFTPGFPASDVPEVGPAVFGYGSPGVIGPAVQGFAAEVARREPEFALEILPVAETLAALRRMRPDRGRPVILADTQDNPGAGGNADTTGLLKALIESGLDAVLAGVIWDPKVAAIAHAAGLGAAVEVALGAHSGFPGERPISGRFRVRALGDGRFTATGPFYRGARMELGAMALLEIGGVTIAVASRKQQAADQSMFRHLGVEPRDFAVVALKSSVHFRADFADLAHEILIVAAPGPNLADPARLPFRNLRPGMRVAPLRGQT